MLWEAYDEALGLSGCNSAVCGADGQIYLAYNRDGGLYVGTVETEDGRLFLAVNRSDGDELTGRSYKYFPAGR